MVLSDEVQEYAYNPEYMELSGDGNQIVFWGDPDGISSFDVFNFHGGPVRRFFTTYQLAHLEKSTDPFSGVGIWDHRMVPGTSIMLFTTGAVMVQRLSSVHNLFSIDIDSGSFLRLRDMGKGGIPEPSPNGKILTVTNYCSISLALINGRNLHEDVFTYPMRDHKCIDPHIVWAADSSRFGTLISGEENVAYWTVDVSTGIASLLGTLEKDFEGILSPTLDYIVDTQDAGHSPSGFPYLEPLEGSLSVRRLKTASSHFISYSPDGKHFAFTMDGNGSYLRLFIGSLDGDATSISDVPDIQSFKWINNRQFVYQNVDSLQLGDIGGNSVSITKSVVVPWYYFDAIDMDFV